MNRTFKTATWPRLLLFSYVGISLGMLLHYPLALSPYVLFLTAPLALVIFCVFYLLYRKLTHDESILNKPVIFGLSFFSSVVGVQINLIWGLVFPRPLFGMAGLFLGPCVTFTCYYFVNRKFKAATWPRLLLFSYLGISLGIILYLLVDGLRTDYFYPLALQPYVLFFNVPPALAIFFVCYLLYQKLTHDELILNKAVIFGLSLFSYVAGRQINLFWDVVLGFETSRLSSMAGLFLGLCVTFSCYYFIKRSIQSERMVSPFYMTLAALVLSSAVALNVLSPPSSHDLCEDIPIGTELDEVIEILTAHGYQKGKYSGGHEYFYSLGGKRSDTNEVSREKTIYINSGGSYCSIRIKDGRVSGKRLAQEVI